MHDALKTLTIFSDTVDVYITGAMTNGATATIVQTSAPGGGPPPHIHTREDETLTILEGEYEFFFDGAWHPGSIGVPVFCPRGQAHTFRNVGKTSGKMLATVAPAGLEDFFDHLVGLSPAMDMPRIQQVFDDYGLAFA
jgi:quercetin dioxygenase-like cupin family protein